MREIVYLVSSEQTGYFYTTTKNKRAKTDKIQVKKYDPIARKHVLFVESSKVSKPKKKKS